MLYNPFFIFLHIATLSLEKGNNMSSTENRARKQELLSTLTLGSTDKGLFDELLRLNEAEEKSKEERQGSVAGLLKSISDLGVQLSEIESAFSNDQISEVALARRIVRPDARGIRSSRAGTSSAVAHSRRSKKTSEALITVASERGFPATYNRGQTLPHFVQKSFKGLFERSGDNFERELAGHFTDAGKSYFVTEAGEKELAKFINFVKTRKANQAR